MYQTILFKAPGKPNNKPVVILSGLAYGRKCSISIAVRLSRALSSAWTWTRCNCTPGAILRRIFSVKATMAVATLAVCAIWWHNVSIENTLDAQRAVGLDFLCASPWAFACAIRSLLTYKRKEA